MLGQCPSCSRPFTAREVAGYGILRARRASAGGPLMELPCPGCGRQLRLVPHGEGRYALPGEPPPPPVPEADRRPPWVDGTRRTAPPRRPPPAPEEEAAAPEAAATAHAIPEPPPAGEAHDPGREQPPLTLPRALVLLDVTADAGAEELERAFHRRSKTCHPDKVAHLDPEFQQLADRKFKRLQAAYELLRRAHAR